MIRSLMVVDVFQVLLKNRIPNIRLDSNRIQISQKLFVRRYMYLHEFSKYFFLLYKLLL